ncbi:hypothetical protein TI39_contig447g00009 [Zymoseptoria brevis]|uniref:BTB domain-containing protein n=1 Tax=Zymoseptoria brevis TaxID=1047168 RepID=A0A0F4GKU6_9PEZI|nr:hypothetical protein TI39_contig447g00009 [Zymoseptoria brevis]
MDTARHVAALFNDPTYSDIIVKAGVEQWYCHKCLLYPASKMFSDECDTSDEEGGMDEVCLDSMYPEQTIEQMLRFIYGSSEADLFGAEQGGYTRICMAAHDFGLPELLKMGLRYLRQALDQVKEPLELATYLTGLHSKHKNDVPELFALADEIEIERMPELLMDEEARVWVNTRNIKAYFNRVVITRKEN